MTSTHRTSGRRGRVETILAFLAGGFLITGMAVAAVPASASSGANLVFTKVSSSGSCFVTAGAPPFCNDMSGGDVISVSASGLPPDEIFVGPQECNDDPSQPVVFLDGLYIPVSCSSFNAVAVLESGTLGPVDFTLIEGTVGPPTPLVSSAPITLEPTCTVNDAPIPNCSTSGDAATDAAAFPCPPTPAQIASGDECDVRVAGLGQDPVVGEILFASQSFSFSPLLQTVTFTTAPPSLATVGGAPDDVAALGGGSGNPVTLTIDPSASSVCTITGSTVDFTSSGTCTIDGNQAGYGDFSAAPQVQQAFSVVTGPVTVTTASPIRARHGRSFSDALAASGGTEPFTWSVRKGHLPPGLTLSPSGLVSGTPSGPAYAKYRVEVEVTDSSFPVIEHATAWLKVLVSPR